MRAITLVFASCAALLVGSVVEVSLAQQPASQTAVPTTPSYASWGNQDKDQLSQSDKQALAKQMDEFHKRLMSLEAGAKITPAADAVEANAKAIEATVEAIGDVKDSLKDKVNAGHSDQRMEFIGRVHLDYWGFPDVDAGLFPLEGGNPQDRIGFRRLRFGVEGDVDDNMFYKLEMEFAGGNDVEYRDAYLGFNNLPCLNTVIAGNHKRPYGLDHLNSSRYNVFMERPFIIEAFNQDARRLGISSNGFSDDLRFNWRAGVFEMEKTQDTFGYVGDHYQLEAVGRLATTWWYDETSGGRGYGHFAVAGAYGEADGLGTNNQARWDTRPEARTDMDWLDTGAIAGADDEYLAAVEAVFNVGPMQLVGEYQYRNVDRLGAFGNNVELHGGYAYASYFLTGEHMPWNRERGTLGRIRPFENFFSVCDCDGYRQRGRGAWQIAARYSYADLTDENVIGGVGRAFTAGLNWYLNPYARWQFNYINGKIDRLPTGEGNYQIFGARFMIDF